MKRHIELKLNIHIHITKSVRNLERMMSIKKEKDVILFASNKHIGYIEELIPKIDKWSPDNIPNIKKINIKEKDIIIGALDCEFSYNKKGNSEESNLICLKLNDNREFVFNSFGKVINKLINISIINNKNIYIYSHNGMKVEHQFIAKEQIMQYTRKNIEPNINYSNIQGASIKTINWKVGNNMIMFYDTLLYMKMPLDQIAKTFETSVPKGHKSWKIEMSKEEKDKWYLEKKWDANNKHDVEYCMNDCKILIDFLNKFNTFIINTYSDYYKKGDWSLVKSSISSINKQYVLNSFPNIINTPLQASIFAESYFGGRNECFFIGEKNYKIISKDINSSYPYEMLKGFAGRFLYEDNVIPENSQRWLGLVELSYKKKYKIPPLCVKSNNKLIFPNIMHPKLLFIWDHEYEAIKDNLTIHSIKSIYHFEEMNLSALITKLYTLKNNVSKTSSYYTSLKVMLNGIYGSLGMNSFRKQKMIITDENTLELAYDEYETSEAFEGLRWLYYSELCNINSAFQCASSITSQARLHLWKEMNRIADMGNEILYCDTDSIYFVANNWKKEESTELGKWDEEKHIYMKILTCKVYIIDNDIKFKGLHVSSVSGLKSQDIIKGCSFKNNQWKINKNLSILKVDIIKYFNLEYNKATILPSGYCQPFDI